MRTRGPAAFVLATLAAAAAAVAQEAAAQTGAPAADTVLLRGRIVTWQGAPIAGAAVALAPAEDLTTASLLERPPAVTDADGRFALPAPALQDRDQKPAELLVASKGRAALARPPGWKLQPSPPGTPSHRMRRAAETDLGDVVLPDGVRMFGRVRDPDGRPLAGVQVLARDLLDSHRALPGTRLGAFCRATTDDRGIFELPCTLDRAVALDVSLPGWLRQTREPVAVGAPLEFTLAPSGFVAGRVLDADGSGVAGATVQASYERRGAVASARTEADGSFRLPLDHDARYRLRAMLRTDDAVRQGTSEILEGAQANLELALEPAVSPTEERLPVRAIAKATGAPLAEFAAAAVWEDYANNNAAYLEYRLQIAMPAAQASKDGVIEVPGPARNAVRTGAVRVLARGHAPATVRGVEWADLEAGAARPPLVAELLPEATLAGTVVDERTGKPIAGAQVWARPRMDANLGTYPDRNPGKAPDDAVATGDDGAFTLHGLGEGGWQLHMLHAQRPRVPPESTDLLAEEHKTGVTLRMPAGARVAGRITGMPVPQGCRVFLHELPRMTFGLGNTYSRLVSSEQVPNTTTAVAADGAFAFEGVRLDNHMLVLVLPSPPRCGGALCLPLEPFRVRADGIQRDFDVGEDQPGSLTGRITFARAAVPFERLVVVAQGVSEEQSRVIMSGTGSLQGPRAFVDKSGQFSLRVGPGAYRLDVVDLLTGIPVAGHEGPLRIKASDSRNWDLAVAVTEVAVRLEPETEGGPTALVDRLEIRFAPKTPAQNRVVMGGNDNYDMGIGIPVPPGAREFVVPLPEGNATFLLRNNVTQLRVDDQRHNLPPLGRQDLEVAPGDKPLECAIKVGAPPEIPAKEPPAGTDDVAGPPRKADKE